MAIEYETNRLREGEAFIVFVNSVEVLKETVDPRQLDKNGFSSKKNSSKTIPLEKGNNLIQFTAESRIEPDLIRSYWDTSDDKHLGHHKMESEAEVAIKRITFKGSAVGGAYACEKCP